jgi:4-hydroxy-tetrahydrodipicolinate synthase
MTMGPALAGVFPVLPTPFDAAGRPDEAGLVRLVHFLFDAGVAGITYPGVASEVAMLSAEERRVLTDRVLGEARGRVPVIVGVSSGDPALSVALGQHALEQGAAALMIAGPADRPTAAAQIDYFGEIAQALPGVPIMLQNVPPPAGAGLDPEAVLQVLEAVPAIAYVKEEALPSGQRLSVLRSRGPAHLRGVFGGAGGRYITDELRRGAAGTMPAIELAEVHVALFAAHRAGDAERARALFTRMLPILNVQAVFRWSLTKHVLLRRGLIGCDRQRAAGPRLDALDQADVAAFLADIADLLHPDHPVR